MTPDTLHGLTVRVAELERLRDRQEASRERMWDTIGEVQRAQAGFQATVSAHHAEVTTDIKEIRDTSAACKRDVQKLRDELTERREQDLIQRAKDRRTALLAGIPLLCALIGAAAVLLSQGVHP